jgi:Dolichyl-phosphate-mannose-protein mannosyltransferase
LTDASVARADVGVRGVVRARRRVRAFARAVPAWAWLAAIVAVSAAIRFVLARGMVAPWIMVDELVYSELAKSFAASGHFEIRGVPAGGSYGFVYPLLISPAYWLFDSVPDAYVAAKAINSVVMSLAAVPAYFLARRVVNRPFALAAAALSVAIPSLVYTGTLMTENAFYAVFLCVALVLVRMLERPTRANQLGALALCALAYGTRQQALALFAAVLTAPLLLGLRRLGRFRTLYFAAGGLAALALVVEAVRGRSPLSLLGAYETAGRHGYSVGAVAKWLLWHVAELDLYLGIIPVAAFVVLAFAWRSLDAPQRAFMAGAATLTGWLLLEVAAFATLPGVARVEERNTFYVAPLFLIALLLWVQLGAPRPRSVAAASAVGAALLVATLPFPRLIRPEITSDTLAFVPWWKVHEQGLALHDVRLVATACALGAAALFLVVPQRWALALPLLVLAYFSVVQQPVQDRAELASHHARAAGVGGRPDWVDRGLPKGSSVGVLWSGHLDPHVVWENEFFNRSIGAVYDVGRPAPGNLASTPVRVGKVGVVRRQPPERLLLSDGTLDLRGARRASDAESGVSVWGVASPVRAVTSVTGLYPNDNWSGPVVVYRRSQCAGGSVHVDLLGDSSLFHRPQTVSANGTSTIVFPGVRSGMTVPLQSCAARFVVSPTKIPGGADRRRLGVHFLTFAYTHP